MIFVRSCDIKVIDLFKALNPGVRCAFENVFIVQSLMILPMTNFNHHDAYRAEPTPRGRKESVEKK